MPELSTEEMTKSFASMKAAEPSTKLKTGELANKMDENMRCFGTLDDREIFDRNMSDMKSRPDPPLPEMVLSKFPYFSEGPFTRPIPTAEEVEAVAALTARPGRCWPASMVFRINEVYAVKVSAMHSILVEAYNLMYLEKMGIRTPKLYAIFSHHGCNPQQIDRVAYTGPLPEYHYLVTEFIDGDLLGDKYASYSPELQAKICASVGDQIQKLRDIPCPHPEYYGLLDGQSWPGTFPDLHVQDYSPRGPWYSYDKFVDALIETARWTCVRDTPYVKDYHVSQRLAFRNYDYIIRNIDTHARRPVLSHMDPHGWNIIVKHGSGNEDFEVVFVDWYSLAWVPAWMGIANFMEGGGYLRPLGDHDMTTYCESVLDRLKGPENFAIAEWWGRKFEWLAGSNPVCNNLCLYYSTNVQIDTYSLRLLPMFSRITNLIVAVSNPKSLGLR
ncbi:kinase-like domain-containing protein [Ampelomyces quisqualis]|uniref:Kinase-like domain-containing protein n=1 Tax=Ampelomyces quisqualis TaxID=50730 RepID=A0A6A5QDR7_AMPQU|nr:kinase-like domain-containing protein [Ampelomyces quisqualis]